MRPIDWLLSGGVLTSLVLWIIALRSLRRLEHLLSTQAEELLGRLEDLAAARRRPPSSSEFFDPRHTDPA